jgi:hypothetical protein
MNPFDVVSDGDTEGDAVAGVAAGADVAGAVDAATVGDGVGVADAPYPVVAEVAAFMLAIHKATARAAPVSRVMMGDLSFMPGSTRKGSRLVQPAGPRLSNVMQKVGDGQPACCVTWEIM